MNAEPLVILTGASRGLGQGVAAQYLAQGAFVLGLARHHASELEAGDALEQWAVDLSAHTIRPSGARTAAADSPPPRLTPTEWRIMSILLLRPEQLVSSAQLLAGVWGPGFQNRTNYLRFHMARLRRKLEDDPSRPRHLLTEPGMGYRYQP